MRNILIALMLTLAVGNATAQTKVQRGVVRKQTFYPNDKIVPVQGVRFVITGASDVSSVVSDANGKFSLSVKDNKSHKFSLAAVRPSTYNLLSPKKGEQIGLHPNDLIYVVVSTADDAAAFKKKIREVQQQKDKEQMMQIRQLRAERDEALLSMKQSDANYNHIKAEYDSLTNLLKYYNDNKDKIESDIDKFVEELSQIDYQSLDSISRQIYEKKCRGEWKSVSDMIIEMMHGNPKATLESIQQRQRQAAENEQQKKMEYVAAVQDKQEADNDFAEWCIRMEDLIESLKMQHLYNSVSYDYEVLIKADSTNWKNLSNAGKFETAYSGYMGASHRELAMVYHNMALRYANSDSLRSTTIDNIAHIYEFQRQYNLALEYYKKALDIRRNIFDEWHPDIAKSYSYIGQMYRWQQNDSLALLYDKKALNIRLNVMGEHHPDTGNSYYSLFLDYRNIRDYRSAIEYCKKSYDIEGESYKLHELYELYELYMKLKDYTNAIECYKEYAEKLKDENKMDLAASAYRHIGWLYKNVGDSIQAMRYSIKGVELEKNVEEGLPCDSAVRYSNIAEAYKNLKFNDKAIEYHKKAVKVLIAAHGEFHSDVADKYEEIGDFFKMQKDYKNTLTYFKKALNIRTIVFGNKDSIVARTYDKIGDIYFYHYEKDSINALENYLQATKIKMTLYGDTSIKLVRDYTQIAYLHERYKDYTSALEYRKKIMGIKIKKYGNEVNEYGGLHPKITKEYEAIASLYIRMKDYLNALKYYQKKLDSCNGSLDDVYESVAGCYGSMAYVYFRIGDKNKELECYKNALEIRRIALGDNHPDLRNSYEYIISFYERQLDYVHMLEYRKKILEIDKCVGGQVLSYSYFKLGQLYEKIRDFDKAVECYQMALKNVQKGGFPSAKNIQSALNSARFKQGEN